MWKSFLWATCFIIGTPLRCFSNSVHKSIQLNSWLACGSPPIDAFLGPPLQTQKNGLQLVLLSQPIHHEIPLNLVKPLMWIFSLLPFENGYVQLPVSQSNNEILRDPDATTLYLPMVRPSCSSLWNRGVAFPYLWEFAQRRSRTTTPFKYTSS